MRSLTIFIFGLLLSVSAQASIITYELSTQTFPGSTQEASGFFTYNKASKTLEALSVRFFGTEFDIQYSIDDLTSSDAFAFESNNNSVFGDGEFEGFELFKAGVFFITGRYVLNRDDTCYFPDAADEPTCNQGLFLLTTSGSVNMVPESETLTLTLLACAFFIARSRRVFNA